MKKIIVGLGLIITSCGLPELKKLKPETQNEINLIVSELKLEKFDYGIYNKEIDGIKRNYFKVSMYDIDDSTNLEPFNLRIINTFNKSGYNLKQYDFVIFYYYKKHSSGDLYKFYKVRADNGEIIEEADE